MYHLHVLGWRTDLDVAQTQVARSHDATRLPTDVADWVTVTLASILAGISWRKLMVDSSLVEVEVLSFAATSALVQMRLRSRMSRSQYQLYPKRCYLAR